MRSTSSGTEHSHRSSPSRRFAGGEACASVRGVTRTMGLPALQITKTVSCCGFIHQARQMGFCLVHVDLAHDGSSLAGPTESTHCRSSLDARLGRLAPVNTPQPLPNPQAAAWHQRGRELQLQGDAAAAEQAYRQALALEPLYRRSLNNLAVLLLQRFEPQQA